MRSRIRVRCEHVFGRMSQLAMDRLRTIGLVRANQHNALSNLVYNMDRYAFLCRWTTIKGKMAGYNPKINNNQSNIGEKSLG